MKQLKKQNRMKFALRIYQRTLAFCGVFFCTVFASATPAFAMNGDVDPVTYINNFYTILCSVVTAIGAIVLLWAIIQFVLAIKGHDAGQRAQSILGIGGGILLCCAPWIVKAIAGV